MYLVGTLQNSMNINKRKCCISFACRNESFVWFLLVLVLYMSQFPMLIYVQFPEKLQPTAVSLTPILLKVLTSINSPYLDTDSHMSHRFFFMCNRKFQQQSLLLQLVTSSGQLVLSKAQAHPIMFLFQTCVLSLGILKKTTVHYKNVPSQWVDTANGWL